MRIKKRLGMGLMSAAVGLALVGGGTFAYFSDSVTANNTFATGTIDLAVEPTEIINLDNLKPGDSMIRDFELQNNGTLNAKTVTLDTDYSGDEELAEHILVKFLYNADQMHEPIFETTLADLRDMSPEAVAEEALIPALGEDGLAAGDYDDLVVAFEFVDNGEDQNDLQGAELQLAWTFTAMQEDGEEIQ